MFGDGPNCEFWRFIIGLDEMAMSCEVGLYLDFGVRDGAPTGCNGRLDNFHMGQWTQGKHYGVALPEGSCPRNLMAFPSGSTPSADLIDLYADDQAAWVEDFSVALVAMLANKELQLVDSGYTAQSSSCNIPKEDGEFICEPSHSTGSGGSGNTATTEGSTTGGGTTTDDGAVRLSSYPSGGLQGRRMVEHEPHNCCLCCGCWCLLSLLLVQVGWRFTEEENGELSVATGGGTRIREQRTFAGRWVSRGEPGRWKMCQLILLGI